MGRAVLRYVRGRLEEIGVRPEFFMGEFKCRESIIFPELVEGGSPPELSTTGRWQTRASTC